MTSIDEYPYLESEKEYILLQYCSRINSNVSFNEQSHYERVFLNNNNGKLIWTFKYLNFLELPIPFTLTASAWHLGVKYLQLLTFIALLY